MLKTYKVIGDIRSQVNKADTIEDALKASLRIITSECGVQYAVVWYFNELDKLLHPYYWLAPTDFTSRTHAPKDGDIGKCFSTGESVRRLQYKKGQDVFTDMALVGVNIGAMLCIPLSVDDKAVGVLQMISTGEINAETADVCEILALMMAMDIAEAPQFQKAAENPETVMKVRGVKRSFLRGTVTSQVLKGVNLDVYDGEFLVLLGESGCGKSTLLNILGGMDEADEGFVEFMGKDITHASDEEMTMFRRKNIGFIFQSYNLMPNLTARQNLDLIGELVDDPMDADEVLDMVGLLSRANSYPSQLSGGQQQRISIARALIKKPKLIFADEPTAALDYTTSIEVLKVLEKIIHTGTTMVMVTHNEEITRMADRVVRMRNGQVYEVTVNRHPVHAEELVW